MSKFLNLKDYKTFESAETDNPGGLTEIQLRILRRFNANWKINPRNGLIDVYGSVVETIPIRIDNQLVRNLMGIKFGTVTGDFILCGLNLESLDGSPHTVNGSFNCSENDLTSLKGSPKHVGGSFNCSNNLLENLEGGPEVVKSDYRCHSNNLVSLKGSPKTIYKDFICYSNELETLEGGPKFVGGDISCYRNKLTSLKGGPKKIGGSKFMAFENKIVSLEGIEEVDINSNALLIDNPIYEVLGPIFLPNLIDLIKRDGNSYKDAVEKIWIMLSPPQRAFLYSEDLDWVDPNEVKKLKLIKKYSQVKDFI